jgi:hypothetical protein
MFGNIQDKSEAKQEDAFRCSEKSDKVIYLGVGQRQKRGPKKGGGRAKLLACPHDTIILNVSGEMTRERDGVGKLLLQGATN